MNEDKKIQVLVMDVPNRDEIKKALTKEFPDVVVIDQPPRIEIMDREKKLPPLPVLTMDHQPEAGHHTFIGREPKGQVLALARKLNLVPVPSKSKTLRTIRKVLGDSARFQCVTVKGKKSVQLFYRPRRKGEEVPVNNVEIPANGSEAGACQALLCALFRHYGMTATWDPKFPGAYRVKPIEGFKGTESQLPLELDPALPVDVDKLGQVLADRANGKTDAATANQEIADVLQPALEAAEAQAPAEPTCPLCRKCSSYQTHGVCEFDPGAGNAAPPEWEGRGQ